MSKSEKIQNLLTEYYSIDTHIEDEKEIPAKPLKVANIDEAESIQVAINEASYFNVTLRRKRLEAIGRKTKIEDSIRKLMPFNVWVPFWVNDEIIHVGFQTSDWPMYVPRMRLRKEDEELEVLKHRITS